jgi:pyruvate/2-oxoglutarate/acetoin dehydrogenase E1 component
VLTVDEGWKTGSISAEIMARVNEQAFFELDAPMERVCSAEVPIPYAKHMEAEAIPNVARIVAGAKRVLGKEE